MDEEISTLIIILILLSVLVAPLIGGGTLDSLNYDNLESERDSTYNIHITSDEELKNYGLPGNGSEENPYLLVNRTIDGGGGNYSIYLENLELHFVIKDCKIYNSTNGIHIESSENITIEGSKIYDNDKGIYLGEGANNNTITNNNISNNNLGIHISESNHNLIYHNIFYQNDIRPQALAEGDNQWDDGESSGNYWSDYENRYPEANESEDIGVWDTAYEIFGEDNEDDYPLISPVGPPTDFVIQPRDEAAKLNWSEPAYSIMYDVETIRIYRKGPDENNLSIHENLTADQDGFMDDNLTNGEEYHYSIKAVNEKYESVKTEVNSVVPDGTPPEVIGFSPEGEDIPIDTDIMIEFSEEMDEESIEISVEDIDGEIIEIEEVERGPNIERTEFYFEPKENLSYDTTYYVSITGRDIAANELEEPHTWSFTTVSDTGIIRGRVVNEEGEPLEDVQIYFDEDYQTSTYPTGEFEIEVPSGNVTLEISKDGYEDTNIVYQINQSEEKEIEDIILKGQEGVMSRWFWPMALAGGGILLLGILALIISFYNWEEEEPLSDEEIYDVDYEDVDAEEFESWWEDEDS